MTDYKLADIASRPKEQLLFGNDIHSQLSKRIIDNSYNPSLYKDNPSASLSQDIVLQVINIQDVTHSKVSLIETYLELKDQNLSFVDRQRRPGLPAQKIVRHVNDGDGSGGNGNLGGSGGATAMEVDPNADLEGIDIENNSRSLFKLTLQDSSGNLSYAMENPQSKLKFLRIQFVPGMNRIWPIQLGSKIIVKAGTKIIYGTLFLNLKDVTFLGGQIPNWNERILDKVLISLKNDINYV